jgi:two-component system, chemotaxis family, protein-glutamate methylesterase/glutaminase
MACLSMRYYRQSSSLSAYWQSFSLEDALSGHDIIVIGASAGGVEALRTLVQALPAHFPASVFVVLHIPAYKPSALPTLLSHAGPLRAFHPLDHALIERECIYVAPPDCHLLLDVGQVRLSTGPTEKGSRPAIDALFRSAAHAYGPRVVGVILTGARDDGTAGLLAVKRSGGVAIVQDPDEAQFSAMPRSALASVSVDYTVPLSGIAPLLVRLVASDDETPSL